MGFEIKKNDGLSFFPEYKEEEHEGLHKAKVELFQPDPTFRSLVGALMMLVGTVLVLGAVACAFGVCLPIVVATGCAFTMIGFFSYIRLKMGM